MSYDFDEIVDRKNTNAMNIEGFRPCIFHDDGTMVFPFRDDEFVRMWVADMEFATPDVVLEAMHERIEKRIFGYTQVFDPAYYEAFSAWTESRCGWHCGKAHLCTSNGIIPALYELVDYITKPDEKVLILTPSYAFFKHAADFNRRTLVCSDLVEEALDYRIDFEDFERKAADPKTTLLIMCNPHNPTGRVWTEEELRRVIEICERHGLTVISDEIHCDLIRSGEKHIPMAKLAPENKRIITCMAPSKTFNMAGLMFSNVIIPDDGIRALWKARHYGFDNPVSIAAAQAAYARGGQWLSELQAYLDQNFAHLKAFLEEELPKARFRIPAATYLAWVDVGAYLPKGTDLPRFFAMKAGVLLEGGDMFVRNSDTFIRLNLAMPRAMLQKGLERIARAVQKECAL